MVSPDISTTQDLQMCSLLGKDCGKPADPWPSWASHANAAPTQASQVMPAVGVVTNSIDVKPSRLVPTGPLAWLRPTFTCSKKCPSLLGSKEAYIYSSWL